MNLFNSMVSKAFILNEARASSIKFPGWKEILKVTREIDTFLRKQYGEKTVSASGKSVPNIAFGTPINELSKRAHAILSDIKSGKIDQNSSDEEISNDLNDVSPGDVSAQKLGANYSDLLTLAATFTDEQVALANEVWEKSIETGSYGQGVESWARRCIFERPKNRAFFSSMGSEQYARVEKEINDTISKYFQGSSLPKITAASTERDISKKQLKPPVVKPEAKPESPNSNGTNNVDFAELRIRILSKFNNPRMKETMINTLLETETDDYEQATQLAEDALESVADAFKNARNVDEIFNSLNQLQSSESSTTADLAEAAFNYLKKIVTVEDEEQPSPEMGTAQAANPAQAIAPTPAGVAHESYVANYMGVSSTYNKPKVIFENNRKKFKPKNIHQLIQAQNQSIY